MLKGAILGLGNIALNGHLPVYAHNPNLRQRAKIIAAADLCPNNREKVAQLYPEIRLYDAAESLMEAEELDFIDVCSPPTTHLAIIETALAKNWHILCEKPLATTKEDMEAISRLLSNPQIVFKPVHQYFYSPHWQTAANICQSQNIQPAYFQARVLRTGANQGNAEWNPGWRTDPGKSGGGIIFDHGVHLFYLAVSLLGEPRKITTFIRNFKHDYPVEDTAIIIIEHEKGVSEISLSWAAQRRQLEFLLIGDNSEILVEENQVRVFKEAAEERFVIPSSLSGNSTHREWYPPLLNNFVNKIINQDFGSEKINEALTATRCALAAYLSAERNCPVSPKEI